MNTPFTGIVVDLFENDFENVLVDFENFKAQYIEVSKMVPEWKNRFPMGVVDELGKALETKDPGKIMPAYEAVGQVCFDCHAANMTKVQLKYHWRDMSTILVQDPLTKEEIPFSLFNINSIQAQNAPQLPEDMAPRTETFSNFDETFVEPQTNERVFPGDYSMNEDGSQSWDGEYRHWHVTPTGDTIVSFLNEAQAKSFRDKQNKQMSSRGIMDLVYDITDPSFGLVPYRPGNDTIPLVDDIAIKNKVNKITKLEANIIENTVNQINATTSGWICDQYMTQMGHIDFFGVYDIDNSGLSSGANLEYDFSTNGDWENVAYGVRTTTTDGVPHAICGNFVGAENLEDNDVTDFNQWYFWEPQTDQQVVPGDYSMDANHSVQIDWYGYEYNSIWNQWGHSIRNVLQYDLLAGNPTLTFQDPDLTTCWDPMLQVEYPDDQTHEFPADISVAANGEPDSLYAGTVYSHSDVSDQTNDGSCSDVTYLVTRTWNGMVGDYNSSNTASATHDQLINVQDTQGAYVLTTPFNQGDTLYRSDMSDSPDPTEEEWAEFGDNSQLSIERKFDKEIVYEDDISRIWEMNQWGEDLCLNDPQDYFNYFVHIPKTVGISEKVAPPKPDNAYVYPNPSNGKFTLEYISNDTQPLETILYNMHGQVVQEKVYKGLVPGKNNIEYGLTDAKPGMYILKTKKGMHFETEKINIK